MTGSEELFERYLKAARFEYDNLEAKYRRLRNPPKHPDYLVHTSTGAVVCEVKEFALSFPASPPGAETWHSTGAGTSPEDFSQALESRTVDTVEKFKSGSSLGHYAITDPLVLILYSPISYGHTEQTDGVNVVVRPDGMMPLRAYELASTLRDLWSPERFREVSGVCVLALNRARGAFLLRGYPNPDALRPIASDAYPGTVPSQDNEQERDDGSHSIPWISAHPGDEDVDR
ncbi:MAG: hypothetical protein HYX75_01400 [Acidobacteria bacterium]|nr:hypothetical protein [Acidobacteriota bacterium]